MKCDNNDKTIVKKMGVVTNDKQQVIITETIMSIII